MCNGLYFPLKLTSQVQAYHARLCNVSKKGSNVIYYLFYPERGRHSLKTLTLFSYQNLHLQFSVFASIALHELFT